MSTHAAAHNGRVRGTIALPLALAACSIAPAPEPPPVIHARFDPTSGVLPMPTDIVRDAAAGKLAIPSGPADVAGKTPAEVALIQILDTRDGWSTRMAAELDFSGALLPSTVGPDSIRVFDATDASAIQPVSALSPAGAPTAAPTKLTIAPPSGGWTRGHRYFIAALGGTRAGRLGGLSGEPVVADPAFWFLRVKEPLTDHADALPGATHDDRVAAAEKLEAIRIALSPYFDHLEALGIARADVAALWSFTVTQSPEIEMDKDAALMPVPSNFLLDPSAGRVALPVLSSDKPFAVSAKQALNQLDGFSLSGNLTFQLSAPIDPKTLSTTTVRLYKVGTTALEAVPITLDTREAGLLVIATPTKGPLEPSSDYLVTVTPGLKDTEGHSVAPMMPGMLALLDAPIAAGGVSQIASVDSESAARVEPVRAAVSSAFATAAASSSTEAPSRRAVAAAWQFHTMSLVGPMQKARDAAASTGVSPDPHDVSHESWTSAVVKFALPGIPLISLSVGQVYEGSITVPDFLDPITHDRRTDGGFTMRDVSFMLTIPSNAPKDRPLKVAIFGHGLMAEHHFVLALAEPLAQKGMAALSIDFPYHGDRTICVASGPQCLINPFAQTGDPICPPACAAGTTCSTDGRCTDNGGNGNHLADWPLVNYPTASGGAFVSVDDLPGTRDHMFQAVTDLSALARSIKDGDWTTAIGQPLDPTPVYVGQSLGGILGSVFVAAHPEIRRAVLNVPGAGLVDLFRQSTTFKSQIDAFLARNAVVPGTIDEETFLDAARWVLDGVDPANFAPFLIHRSIDSGEPFDPASREMIIQMATLDAIVPNSATELLERLSGVTRHDYIAEHAFLCIPIEPAYGPGTRDAAALLADGVLP
jgi:hypothetical protein